MNNDPYSWFNIDRLDKMIKDQQTEFKRKELEKEEGAYDTGEQLLLRSRFI